MRQQWNRKLGSEALEHIELLRKRWDCSDVEAVSRSLLLATLSTTDSARTEPAGEEKKDDEVHTNGSNRNSNAGAKRSPRNARRPAVVVLGRNGGGDSGRSADTSSVVPQPICLICEKFLGKSTDARFKPHMEHEGGRCHIECFEKGRS